MQKKICGDLIPQSRRAPEEPQQLGSKIWSVLNQYLNINFSPANSINAILLWTLLRDSLILPATSIKVIEIVISTPNAKSLF